MNKTTIAVASLCGLCFVMTAHSQPYTFTTMGGLPLADWHDGPLTAEYCYNPWGIALDSAGKLYVTDSFACQIKLISPPQVSPGQTAWTFSAIAGSQHTSGSADGIGPDASFFVSMGIVRDGAGNLYVADAYNHETTATITPSAKSFRLFPTGRRTGWLARLAVWRTSAAPTTG